MRKFLVITCTLLVISTFSYSQQVFQATVSNVGNRLSFKIKPTASTTTDFSVVEFFVRYPVATPAFTYGPLMENTTNFPGIDFELLPEAAVDGYKIDHFVFTAPTPPTTPATYDAGVEYEVFSVDLLGAGTVDFELVDGEDIYNIHSPFYLALTDGGGRDIAVPDHSNYFYPSTTVTGTVGARIYSQSLANVILPVKFLSFYAMRNGGAAKLSWTVSQDNENKYFEVERSLDGKAFNPFTQLNALDNGRNTNTYETTDELLSKLGTKSVYYRIKQFDKNGSSILSPVRKLDVNSVSAISAFPNPTRSISKLLIDASVAGKGSIIVRDANGKQLQIISTQFNMGVNQKDVNLGMLPAGDYNLTVIAENINQTIKVTKIN